MKFATLKPARTFVPGPGGYVLGVLISCLVCAVLLVLPGLRDYSPLDALAVVIVYVPLTAVFCATYGLPVAVAGIAVVRLCCRRARSRAVHVLATGLAAGILGFGWLSWTLPWALRRGGGPWGLWVPVVIGVSAAVGRLVTDRWIRLPS